MSSWLYLFSNLNIDDAQSLLQQYQSAFDVLCVIEEKAPCIQVGQDQLRTVRFVLRLVVFNAFLVEFKRLRELVRRRVVAEAYFVRDIVAVDDLRVLLCLLVVLNDEVLWLLLLVGCILLASAEVDKVVVIV